MKAFIFDPLWDELITQDLLQKIEDSGLELVVTKEVAPLTECQALYEGNEDRILCLNPDYVNWNLSEDAYENIPNLKAILGAATSFSWIDMSVAKQKNIPVCNIRNFSTQAVAEWAILMMFNVARQVPRLIKEDFPLDFDRDFMTYRGTEIKGKTVGIIGLGDIGSAIAERASGLGMKVIYWSPSEKENTYERAELIDLFTTADVIFPTMAVNEESKKIITAELLSHMKATAMLVSVVHDLFDEETVLNMVKEERIYGFAFEGKPGEFNKYEGNVWAAPAYAWTTDGSMHNSMDKWIQNMVEAQKGSFPNRVN